MDSSKHACMLHTPLTITDLPPTAHWLRRFTRKLRRAFLACAWHKGSVVFLRSRKCLEMNRENQLLNSYWFIWHPYSPVKFYWDCFTMLSNWFANWYMPCQVFYTCPDPADKFILATDAIAFCDILVILVSGYHDEDNKQFILSPAQIALHYLKGLFIFDLIGALPLQLYQPFENCEYPSHTVFYLVKLFRMFNQQRKTEVFLEQMNLTYSTSEIVIVFVRLLYFFHWMTFIHYQVPAFCTHFYDITAGSKEDLWLQRFNVNKMSGLYEKYVTNLYFVCGICIGAGYYSPVDDILIPEMILNSMMGIVSLIILADCFMTVIRLVLYSQYQRYAYDSRLNDLEKYMIDKRLPKSLRQKIQLFINYKFSGNYFSEESILSTLNEQIKQDINMHWCKRLVTNVPLFRDMPVALITAIIFSLKQETLIPGQVVLKCGYPSDCMYFISYGSVTVMDENGREIIHLNDGEHFGETAMLHSGSPATISVTALEITMIFVLHSQDFQKCIKPYHHLKRRLEENRRRRDSLSRR